MAYTLTGNAETNVAAIHATLLKCFVATDALFKVLLSVKCGAWTRLSSDLLFDALLGLGQCRHGGHVGPAQRPHHGPQDHVSKQLPHVGEEYVQHSVPDLNRNRRTAPIRPNI